MKNKVVWTESIIDNNKIYALYDMKYLSQINPVRYKIDQISNRYMNRMVELFLNNNDEEILKNIERELSKESPWYVLYTN